MMEAQRRVTSASLLLLGVLVGCKEGLSPVIVPGVSLVIVSGNGQSKTVGSELPQPVVVRATDSKGKALPGIVVNFRVTSGGGSVYAGAAITDLSGLAADWWTIGTSTSVAQQLEVRTVHPDGRKEVFGTFTANPQPGPPATIAIVNGGFSQWRRAGSAVLRRPSIRVVDQYANPVGGLSVNFAATSGGGSTVAGSATTLATGVATIGDWFLGPAPGPNTLTATVIGNPTLSALFHAIGNTGDLYVTNYDAHSVTVYSANATGNATPTITLQGAATGISSPRGIAIDGWGNIHVVNLGTKTVTTYALGASGNAAPIRTIGGGNTELTNPEGIAADAAGNLYVSNQTEGSGDIVVFAAGANGNVSPIRKISGGLTGLHRPMGLAVDPVDRLYVVSLGIYNSCCQSVRVFSAGANGNAVPVRTIAGGNTVMWNPLGITVDDVGNILVSSYGNTDAGPSNASTSIVTFTPGQNGNVAPAKTIQGDGYLSEPTGVAVTPAGLLYTVNFFSDAIAIYPPGASGSIAPSMTISGPATGLNRPSYITF